MWDNVLWILLFMFCYTAQPVLCQLAAPSSVNITNPTTNSFNVEFSAVIGATSYDVTYTALHTPTDNGTLSTTSTSVLITGRRSNIRYNVVVTPINVDGAGTTSTAVAARTAPDGVGILTFITTPTFITMYLEQLPGVTGFEVEVNNTHDASDLTVYEVPDKILKSLYVSVVLNRLPNTEYSVRVRASQVASTYYSKIQSPYGAANYVMTDMISVFASINLTERTFAADANNNQTLKLEVEEELLNAYQTQSERVVNVTVIAFVVGTSQCHHELIVSDQTVPPNTAGLNLTTVDSTLYSKSIVKYRVANGLDDGYFITGDATSKNIAYVDVGCSGGGLESMQLYTKNGLVGSGSIVSWADADSGVSPAKSSRTLELTADCIGACSLETFRFLPDADTIYAIRQNYLFEGCLDGLNPNFYDRFFSARFGDSADRYTVLFTTNPSALHNSSFTLTSFVNGTGLTITFPRSVLTRGITISVNMNGVTETLTENELDSSSQYMVVFRNLSGSQSYQVTLSGSVRAANGDVLNTGQTYLTATTEPSCGFTATAAPKAQTLTSPRYPSNYPRNSQCYWLIRASEGKQVHLTVERLDTEASFDYLEVYDNDSETNLIGDLHGRVSGHSFISTNGVLLVHFVSDGSVQRNGFTSLFYEVETPVVGRTSKIVTDGTQAELQKTNVTVCEDTKVFVAPGKNVTIKSINYPNSYGNNLNCWLVVTTTEGTRLKLLLDYFATESCCDSLTLFDSDSTRSDNPIDQLKGELATGGAVTGRFSPSNRLALQFISDGSVSLKGFSGVLSADINECSSSPCDMNAECNNTDGSFNCTCNTGFNGNGLNCTDINECLSSPCDINAECNNTDGSFNCTCNMGHNGDGFNCTDINECLSFPCDLNAECNNLAGSYVCTCNTGYKGTGLSCLDTNECLSSPCDLNAECSNTDGSFECTCISGYKGTGFYCTDINECLSLTCGSNAECINTVGSFDCTCNPGYFGNGTFCQDNCLSPKQNCHENATCTRTSGGFSCTCKSGYTGDGVFCEKACLTSDDTCVPKTTVRKILKGIVVSLLDEIALLEEEDGCKKQSMVPRQARTVHGSNAAQATKMMASLEKVLTVVESLKEDRCNSP